MENNNKKVNAFTKFRELWKNKRYRSLIILGFYGIFFIFIFLFLNSIGNEPVSISPKEEPKTALQNYAEIDNYEFSLEIIERKDNINMTYNYNGMTVEDVTLINDKFYLKDDVIYEIINEQIKPLEASLTDINLFKLKPANLAKLINLGELNYETKFADGSIEKSYLIPLKDVIENFDNEQLTDPKKTIEIKYKEKDSSIDSMEIDLVNYQKRTYENIDFYTVKIVYSNIGLVEPLKSDYQIVTSS